MSYLKKNRKHVLTLFEIESSFMFEKMKREKC